MPSLLLNCWNMWGRNLDNAKPKILRRQIYQKSQNDQANILPKKINKFTRNTLHIDKKTATIDFDNPG